MKATLKNHNQSPRKMRELIATVQGRRVDDALLTLSGVNHKSAPCLQKLIRSAAASAKQKGTPNPEQTHKIHAAADKGIEMRRVFLLARGRANRFRKTRSHITVSLQPITS